MWICNWSLGHSQAITQSYDLCQNGKKAINKDTKKTIAISMIIGRYCFRLAALSKQPRRLVRRDIDSFKRTRTLPVHMLISSLNLSQHLTNKVSLDPTHVQSKQVMVPNFHGIGGDDTGTAHLTSDNNQGTQCVSCCSEESFITTATSKTVDDKALFASRSRLPI